MKKLLIIAAVVVVLGVMVIVSLSRGKEVGETVYAGEVESGDVVRVVTGTGVIQPRTKVNISSEVLGQIVDLPVKEGQTVSKGDLLVRIDPERYRAQTNQLSANLRMSRIAIESEDVSLKNLEIDQRRARQLHAEGIVPSSEMEKADLAVETSLIRLKSLKESVAQADASYQRAQDDLGKTTIYAPMAGKITQVNTEVGEQVIIGTTNIPGSVILVISDMSEVLAEVSVDETEVVALDPGQRAEVTADAVEKTTYEGTVAEIRNTAKKEGDVNVFGVKILLSEPDARLRPGMTAKARIEVERHEEVLRVPIQAVATRERKKLEDDRKAAGRKAPIAKGAVAGEPGAAKEGATAPERTADATAETSGPAGEAKGEGSASAEGALAGKEGGGDGPRSGANPPAASARDEKPGERDEIEVVYVIEDKKVRAVPVKTGASEESFVEIREGLEKGQKIVTGPYRVLKRLKDGDRVIEKKEGDSGTAKELEGQGEER